MPRANRALREKVATWMAQEVELCPDPDRLVTRAIVHFKIGHEAMWMRETAKKLCDTLPDSL